MTARTTMKLKSLLPGIGDMQFDFPTKPSKEVQKKIQRALQANVERIMVKHGADAREKNKKMARTGAKGPIKMALRKKDGKKAQVEKRAAIQHADDTANEEKRWQAMNPQEKFEALFDGV